MTSIAITAYGSVSGTNAALVAAAVDVLEKLPAVPVQRRVDELVAAVTLPLMRVSVAA